MTPEKLKSAQIIMEQITERKAALQAVSWEDNPWDLPEDLFKRHLREKCEFLEAEIAKLERMFVEL